MIKFFKKIVSNYPDEAKVCDNDIIAIADGELIDVSNVNDPVFAKQMLGKSIAFRFTKETVTLCSPANGVLELLFPTGHAYGIKMHNGVEILIHIGINTVNKNGEGFRILNKKQGDTVYAGDPIVEVDMKMLEKEFDMSTMLIITNNNNCKIEFRAPCEVKCGGKLNIN